MNGKTKRVKFKQDVEPCPSEISELIKRPECYFNLGLKDGQPRPRPTPDQPIPVVPSIPSAPQVIGLPVYELGFPSLKQDMTNYNQIPRIIASDVQKTRRITSRPKRETFDGVRRDITDNIQRRKIIVASNLNDLIPDGRGGTRTKTITDRNTTTSTTTTPRRPAGTGDGIELPPATSTPIPPSGRPPPDTGAGVIPQDLTPAPAPDLTRAPSLGIDFTNVDVDVPDITPRRGTSFARPKTDISPLIRGLSVPKFLQFEAVQDVLQRFRTDYLPGDTRDLKPVELAKIVRSYYEDLKTTKEGTRIKTKLTTRQKERMLKEIKTGIRVHLMNVDVEEEDIKNFIESEERRTRTLNIQENREFIQEQRDRGITITNNSGKRIEEDEKMMGKIRRMIERGDRELTISGTGEVSRGGTSGTELQDTRIRRGGRLIDLPDPPPDPPPSPPSGSRRYNPLDEEFGDAPADTGVRRGGRLIDPDDAFISDLMSIGETEAQRRLRIQQEIQARRVRTTTRPIGRPRTGFMPSMSRAFTRLVEQEQDIGTELTNIRDTITDPPTSAPAPDDPSRIADITSRTRDLGLGDHVRIGADGTATIDGTLRTTPNTADLNDVRNDPRFNQPVFNNDTLTMNERIALARQSIQSVRETPLRELTPSAAGALGGIGVGYGVSELMASQGANIYANAFTSGALGDVGGRIVGRAAEQAAVRAGILGAEDVVRLSAPALARGALEGGAIGLALLPVDMMLNHYLTNDMHLSHMDANLISGTAVGLAATGAMGLTALAFAPETFGTSVAVGLLAVGVSDLIGVFTGSAEDRRERERAQQIALQEQQRQEALDAINNTNTQNEARKELLASLPQYGYDFDRAWTAFDRKDDLGMGVGDYADFTMGYRAIFQDEPTQSPITPTTDPTADPEKQEMDRLISQHILHNLIERICNDPGGCLPSLRAQQPPELTQEQINKLDEATAGTWRGQADVSIEGSYQEMHHTTALIHDAQRDVFNEWDENGRTLEEIKELDPVMYKHATNDPTFEERFNREIINESQRQIVDAYYTDLTKLEDMDSRVVEIANRDPEFSSTMNEYYEGMEASASALGISVPQLMELQTIPDNTRVELPVAVGRREYDAINRQEGLIRQQERYIEMLQENSENPDVDNQAIYLEAQRRLQEYNQNIRDLVAGLNQENQAYIDNYNANINQRTNIYGAEYSDIINRYNEMQGYFGRDDLLSFGSSVLYNNNRVDAPDIYNPTSTPTAPLSNDPNIINPSPQLNYVNYTDIQNYIETIDGYDQLSKQGKRDMFDYYANNLNALPTYITDGKDIPTDQQKGRLAPVEKQLVQSFQERDDTSVPIVPTPVRQEQVVVDRAPPPTRARPTEPAPTPVQSQTTTTPQGNISIAPTT
jgi:hypothetical protein